MKILTKKAWDKFDHENPKQRKILAQALQFAFSYPDLFTPERFRGSDAISKKFQEKRKAQRAAMQAFTVLGDFPASPKDVIDMDLSRYLILEIIPVPAGMVFQWLLRKAD